MLGMSSHGGDANSWGRHGTPILNMNKLAAGINLSLPISHRLYGRLHFHSTTIEGDDRSLIDKELWGRNHADRAYMYRSSIHEIGVTLHYFIKKDPIDRRITNKEKVKISKWSSYIFGGFAYALVLDDHDSRHWTNPPAHKLNDVLLDKTYGSKGGIQIPIGGAIRYDIRDNLFLDFFYSLRLPISDYIDGISEAGNPDKNDAYQFCGVMMGYRFGVEGL